MKKRILSLLVAFAMVLSLFTVLTLPAAANTLSVQLMVRHGDELPGRMDGETWQNHPNSWWSASPIVGAAVSITKEGTFSVTLTEAQINAVLNAGATGFDSVSGIDQLTSLAIITEGANFADGVANPFAGLTQAPADWADVQMEITSVTINGAATPNFAPTGEAAFAWPIYFDATGDDAHRNGFVDVGLWNAWHAPGRVLTGGAPNASFGSAEAPATSFRFSTAATPVRTTSITVNFRTFVEAGGCEICDPEPCTCDSVTPPVTTGGSEPGPSEPGGMSATWKVSPAAERDATVTQVGGSNHIMKLELSTEQRAAIAAADGGDDTSMLTISFTTTSSSSQRRIVAWSSLSGASVEDIAFLTGANLEAAAVAISVNPDITHGAHMAASVITVNIPKALIFDGTNAATAIYFAITINAGAIGTNADGTNRYVEASNHRGGGTNNEFNAINTAGLVVGTLGTARAIYDMASDPNLQHLAGEGGSPSWLLESQYLLRRSGAAATNFAVVTTGTRSITVTGRAGGSSNGVQFRLDTIGAKPGHSYRFEAAGTMSIAATARLRLETPSSNPGLATAATSGANNAFSISATMTTEQITAAVAAGTGGMRFISIGCTTAEGGTFPDMVLTNIRVVALCPDECTGCSFLPVTITPPVDETGAATTTQGGGDQPTPPITDGPEPTPGPTGGPEPTDAPPTSPPATPPPNNQGDQVELIAVGAGNWALQRGTAVTINGNRQYTASLTLNPGQETIMQFALVSAGGIFGEANLFANATQAPANWWNTTDDTLIPQITINAISFNNGAVTRTARPLTATENSNLVEQYWAPANGYVNYALWCAWTPANRRIQNVTETAAGDGGDPGFSVPGAANITQISVVFTITNFPGGDGGGTTAPPIGPTQPPPTGVATPPVGTGGNDPVGRPCAKNGTGVRVQLMAREAVDWITNDDGIGPWRGESFLVCGDGTYTTTIDTPGGFDRIIHFGLYSTNTIFDPLARMKENAFPPNLSALTAPQRAQWSDAMVTFNSVVINENVNIGLTNTWPDANEFGNESLISSGFGPTEGFVSIALWNGWHSPHWRLTDGVEQADTVDPGNSDLGEPAKSFRMTGGGAINSITVTFTVNGTGIAGTCCAETPGGKLGDVNGDNALTILDALEILMYLAGMPSELDKPANYPQGLITAGSKTANKVGISDALEILIYLAGMPTPLRQVWT
jgi:hypothetical protein